MTNKDFKEGMELNGTSTHIFHPKDFKEGMENKNLEEEIMNGYPNARKHFDSFVERQPKPRTIDDLECGDYVVRDGCVSKCLGRCGEIVSLSYSDKGSTIGNWDKQYYLSYTMWELKNYGYTLYQPEEVKETDIDKCIKVVEEYFKKLVKPVEYSETVQDAIVQALKNLKNRYETKNN